MPPLRGEADVSLYLTNYITNNARIGGKSYRTPAVRAAVKTSSAARNSVRHDSSVFSRRAKPMTRNAVGICFSLKR